MPTIESENPEPVWKFRGYELRPGEFNTAMVHFFRAEITRSNVWRQRLDTTTNWAVVTTGAAISFAFSQVEGPHLVILLNLVLVTMFLYIEARRYRYYELWSYRVRLMETDFFATMLVPPFQPAADWAESLAENLLHPQFPISMWEAFGRRYRRNYFWIYAILALAWLGKLSLYPDAAKTLGEIVQRATIGPEPGWVIFLIWAIFHGTLLIIGLYTVTMHQASGEVFPRYAHDFSPQELRKMQGKKVPIKDKMPWSRQSRRRPQLLAWLITKHPDEISKRIMDEMNRGVTRMEGIGQYTKTENPVLMSAITLTEVPHLKNIVQIEDPNAFLIVSQAHEVFGKGFEAFEG